MTRSEGERRQALARLLPRLYGTLDESREKINLEAYGLPPAPGESPLVGPFDVFDARLHLAESLLDLSANAKADAAARRLAASRFTQRDARDRVVAAVADLYLDAVASRARIESAQAQVATAEAASQLAADRHDAGSAASIDVLRADVNLAAQRQRLIAAENAFAKRKLALARAVGLPLGRPLELTTALPFATLPLADLDQALATAERERADLAAGRAEVDAAQAEVRAAARQRLPRLEVAGDVGKIGPDSGSAEDTFSISAGVRVPLFEGGRIAGEVVAARGRLDAAEARLADLRRQVELEVRAGYLDADAARRQLDVARDARGLAEKQLTQARDRYAAGVGDSLEVVQALEDLAAANEGFVSSLQAYNRAKVSLALALGLAEGSAARFLEGERP